MTRTKIIEDWVTALRSGKYTQVVGTLKGERTDGSIGYCCLGVFCEINDRNVTPVREDTSDGVFYHEGAEEHYDFCREQIFEDVVDVGIKMNDTGKSFSEIADMIESHYKDVDK